MEKKNGIYKNAGKVRKYVILNSWEKEKYPKTRLKHLINSKDIYLPNLLFSENLEKE